MAFAETALSGFGHVLGLEMVEATGDHVKLALTVKTQLLQPHGIVHGGVYCAMVETAASAGAALWYGDRGRVVGVSNYTDFLAAARHGVLTAVATPIHRGRLQQLWLVEVSLEGGKVVARGHVRFQNLEDASPASPRP